jgi:small subunit ribosomal protein S8
MVTDSIGDFLARIKNAQLRRRQTVSMPATRLIVGISEVLKKEGFMDGFEVADKEGAVQKELTITLKYDDNMPAIRNLVRVSKPGVRQYVGYKDIPVVQSGMGISIITTSKGILSSSEAMKQKIGGEFLCKVW